MKVALCLSGHLRSYQETYPALKRFILDNYRVDVFIHTWIKQGFDAVRGDAAVVNKPLDALRVQALYNCKDLLIEENKKWDTSMYAVEPNIGLRNPEIVCGLFYSQYTSNQLKCKYEAQHGKYDVVIRCRADLMLEDHLHMSEMEQACQGVLVPKFGNYNGLNDQFALGNSAHMDQYCNTFPNLHSFYQQGCKFHPESLQRWCASHYQIPILRSGIKYYIQRNNGDRFRNAHKTEYGDV